MAGTSDSDEPVGSLDSVDRLSIADEPLESSDDGSLERLGLELVTHQHDRIHELYYEDDCSDAAAEAVALSELGLTPAGITVLMAATGREDVSERTVATYIDECRDR